MKHLYMCEQLNLKDRKYPYESIFSDNLYKQSEVLKIMQENIEKRNTYKRDYFMNTDIFDINIATPRDS